MIPVNIDGEILFRSRRGGQFTKMLSGGGKEDLGIVQAHYHCRAGLEDEYNIGFNNPAIIDISPPILQVVSPHKTEKKR
eukprot:12407304-Karenia_brevis.AAC.1